MADDNHIAAHENATGPAAARVILTGRTGLDAQLRLDDRIELVRARTALEAIGELSDPIDEASPADAVVVVGDDAAPPGDHARDFVDSLRLVNPSVRVLRMGPQDGASHYDGAVDMEHPADSILHAGASVTPVATPAAVPHAQDNGHTSVDVTRQPMAPPFPTSAEADSSAADAPGDGALVACLLHGNDPVQAALRVLRARLGDTATFTPEAVEGSTPVAHRGRIFGYLYAPGDGATLAAHAAWLAQWMVLRDQHAQLRSAAFTDALTGAWNRRYVERFLGLALASARRERRTVTVMVFDIDDFKSFNDRYSHAAGDAILVETVKLLQSVIRPTDRVCRIGGDEFVVIFHEPPREAGSTAPTSVFELARRFQREICEHRFPKLGNEAPGTLTISAGLASFPWDGRTVEELLRTADELAIKSKRQGKNALTLGPGAARVCDVMG